MRKRQACEGESNLWSFKVECPNFVEKLEFDDASLDPHKDIKESLVTHEKLVYTFGVRQQIGCKAIVNEFFIVQDCEVLLKLYKDVYAHPPQNGNYLAIFCVVG